MSKVAADALERCFISQSVDDVNLEPANVVDALAIGMGRIANQLKWLGNGDAGATMGAVEAHGVAIKDAGARVGNEINEVASAIHALADAGVDIAAAINRLADAAHNANDDAKRHQ